MPLRVPNFEQEVDPNFAAIDKYVEGGEHSYAQGSGVPPQREEEEEEKEVEDHRRRNRRNRCRGRPDPHEEFQADTSAQLGDMYSYLQNMSNTWDTRWAELHQINNFNQQGWEAQGDWSAAETDFWEAQRLEDVHR